MDRKSEGNKAPAKISQSKQYLDEQDGVSMHTTRDDYDYEDSSQLPSYTESLLAAGRANDHYPSGEPPPPADEYEIITPPKSATDGWRVRKFANKSCPRYNVGNETTVRMDERLSHPTQLYDYVNDYLSVVQPRPAVRVQGWHRETRRRNNKNEEERVYDFDILLSLQAFLSSQAHTHNTSNREEDSGWWVPGTAENGDKVHRGSWRKTRAKGFSQDIEVGSDRKLELLDWCEDFCASRSALKIFRVGRIVTGLDTEYIKEQVEMLVRQTHYSGHVDITFPTANKNVDIYSPHWVNQARISWVRWIFYLTFLWIFTWPILLFTTKRWSVYQVEWPFSRTVEGGDGRQRKIYATISEAAWVKRHANLIRVLVLDKFHGHGTNLPLDADVQRGETSSGPSRGNVNPAVVSFLHTGVSVLSDFNTRRGGITHGWGADS